MPAFEIERREKEWVKAEYADLWDTIREELPELAEEQAVIVASIVLGVCPGCYEWPRGECYCRRDD